MACWLIGNLAEAAPHLDRVEDARARAAHVEAAAGDSPAIRSIRQYLPKVAASDCTILITGETGTGKERVAELIHWYSTRRNRPFICINCAALPDTLLESELFGHEKGAFTGAHSSAAGKLAQANGGTVLFDEIGDMSLSAQAKILRAIESKVVCPVGGTRSSALDIRVDWCSQAFLPRSNKTLTRHIAVSACGRCASSRARAGSSLYCRPRGKVRLPARYFGGNDERPERVCPYGPRCRNTSPRLRR